MFHGRSAFSDKAGTALVNGLDLMAAPSFVDLFGMRLASRLVGPHQFARQCEFASSSEKKHRNDKRCGSFRVYWRAALFDDPPIRALDPTFVGSTTTRVENNDDACERQRVLFVDVTIHFVVAAHLHLYPHLAQDSDHSNTSSHDKQVFVQLGALISKPGGAQYLQASPLTEDALRNHASQISVDFDETEPVGMANLLAHSFLSHGEPSVGDVPSTLSTKILKSADGSFSVLLNIYYPELLEEGTFTIDNRSRKSIFDEGHVGHSALQMVLAATQFSLPPTTNEAIIDRDSPSTFPGALDDEAASSAFHAWWQYGCELSQPTQTSDNDTTVKTLPRSVGPAIPGGSPPALAEDMDTSFESQNIQRAGRKIGHVANIETAEANTSRRVNIQGKSICLGDAMWQSTVTRAIVRKEHILHGHVMVSAFSGLKKRRRGQTRIGKL